MRRLGGGLRVQVSGEGGEGGEGGDERAAAHGVDGGEQVRGVILAHVDRDSWVGAWGGRSGAGRGRHGRSAWTDGTAVRAAPLLRQQVVRLQRTKRKRAIRKGGYPLPPTFTI
jgi:hypothetical protein